VEIKRSSIYSNMKTIVCAKYVVDTPKHHKSIVWKENSALQQLDQTSCSLLVGNDKHTAFLIDHWLGDCALMSVYYHLFFKFALYLTSQCIKF
jgi:hypothetical protein